MSFPFGPCQCVSGMCPCSDKPGPAMFSVTRKGKQLLVCSRCDLTSDKDQVLLLTDDTPMQDFVDHDSFGVLVAGLKVLDQRQAQA